SSENQDPSSREAPKFKAQRDAEGGGPFRGCERVADAPGVLPRKRGVPRGLLLGRAWSPGAICQSHHAAGPSGRAPTSAFREKRPRGGSTGSPQATRPHHSGGAQRTARPTGNAI